MITSLAREISRDPAQRVRRCNAAALKDAMDFRNLFHQSCFLRWEFGGSVRRGKPLVGDVEHIVIPASGLQEVKTGLFAEQKQASLLWVRLEELVGGGAMEKFVYRDGKFRWGEKYRGVLFRGFRHEIFVADFDNWGSILAVRTGPDHFSRALVTALNRRGYRHEEGRLWLGGKMIPTRDEQALFEAAGINLLPPEKREDSGVFRKAVMA
ncbi:MAG: hypothetical protein ABSF29_14790 [Tepidisphaeraceae bacterium]|jgi:DNA polymerase/3'-5' exonuclease PolX